MTTATLYDRLHQGLWWNALEAMPYQLILTVHQALLFSAIDATRYGLAGALFSLVYLAVAIINLGFDVSLPSFFTQATQSQKSFKDLICVQYFPVLGILMSCAILMPLLGPTLSTTLGTLSPMMLVVLGLLVMVESIKKTCRTLLHIAFYNNYTALIELGQIVSYVSFIWGSYAHGYVLDLQLLFVPLLVISTVCMSALVFLVYAFYQSLPQENDIQIIGSSSVSGIMRNRFFNTILIIGHQLFSGNVLVPLFAYRFGLREAGVLKLICNIAHGITICLQKIFGSTSEALFAHVKHEGLAAKRIAFHTITRHLYGALYGVIIFFALTYEQISVLSMRDVSHSSFMLALLFFIIHISEQFFIAYEKFYLAEDRTFTLLLFTVITSIAMYGVVHSASSYAPLFILQLVFAVRIISFAALGACSFWWWRIRPAFRVNPLYIIGSLIASLSLFLLAR